MMSASERDEVRARIAAAMRRALWVRWGEYAPDGDETLGSLGDEARAGYTEAAAAVLAELARTHVLAPLAHWEAELPRLNGQLEVFR